MKLIFSLTEKAHGPGPIQFAWQNGGANYIATTGYDNNVNIYDRHGELIDEIPLAGTCTAIVWDKDGDLLAITNNNANAIVLWDVNTRRTTQLDSSMGLKDTLTFAAWSRVSPVLAVGNSKGNMLLYNQQTARKVPVIGKHTRRITCGAFSDTDLLALGADDQQLSVSNLDGDTLFSFACTADPAQIQFAEMKQSERSSAGETTVVPPSPRRRTRAPPPQISAVIGKRVLMLINLNEAENPINLQFQARYGDIASYRWFGDGYVLLGFEQGFLVCISTHASEIGQEIFSVQDHKSYMSALTINTSFDKAITAGDNCVKVRELRQLSEVFAMVELDGEDKGLDKVELSSDGQLLAISGATGALHVYLTRLPVLGAASHTRIAALSSLTEVTVYNDVAQERPLSFDIEVEPSFIGCGPLHVAVGMNNRAWFYVLSSQGAETIRDFEYLGSVQRICLNAQFAAAMLEGRVQLHKIEESADGSDEGGRIFPDADKSAFKISSFALTADFLIVATDGGHVQYFSLDDWKYVNEYRHTGAVGALWADEWGTRLCFVDDRRDVFVYSPVNDCLVRVPRAESTTAVRGVLWEQWPADKDVFVVFDGTFADVFVFDKDHLEGEGVKDAGRTKLPFGHAPLLLYNGQLTCQTQSGRTSDVTLDACKDDLAFEGKSDAVLMEMLSRFLLMKRWLSAWRLCELRKDKTCWKRLGRAAMERLDVELAVRVFRQMGDVGMVWSLEELAGCEDRHLLAGHLAMFLERFDLAEKFYLTSSAPIEALEMRRDLLHWDKTLQLANRLAPDQIPFISKEFAQQLEFSGEYGNALAHYEKGLTGDDKMRVHDEVCEGGIARMSLRMGDIRRGAKMALESQQRSLKKECGAILESMKQYNEAAQVFESGQLFDRAAAVCVKAKNWMKVGELLANVHSPKVHSQYAKAMEAERKYQRAADAYRHAKDYDNLVRVLLEHLNSAEEAVSVVRDSRSVEGAKLVSKFFLRIGDQASAIQFLVMSQCRHEAFRLAEECNKMEIYAEAVEGEATADDYELIANTFERQRKPLLAGKFYYLSGHHIRALDLLLTNGEDDDALKLAIQCVADANNPELTARLTAFLMGEVDGIPKDAKYLFRLFVALKMFREAARTAIIIAREEQAKGQYRLAHDLLFGMYQELKNQTIAIPLEMSSNLMLIHSYLIVKPLIKRGAHLAAARMLIRVANNVSKFPAHTVQILTSAVIECSKVGLKQAAFRYAAILMRPEYRKMVDEKYRKKIEAIVRKMDKSVEADEPATDCIYCDQPLAETQLSCANCKNTLPYCIITGRHLVKNDFGCCPSCSFPALFSEIRRCAEAGDACTMCGERLVPSQLEAVTNVLSYLQSTNEAENR